MNPISSAVSFLSAALLVMPLAGMTPAIAATPDRTGLYERIPPREESTIEETAVVVYRHIAQARADIHRGTPERARNELDTVERVTNSMREYISTAVPRNLIAAARKHLEFEPGPKVARDDLPPIYSALDRIAVYFPVDRAKRHLDRAGEELKKNDKKGAQGELAMADGALVTVEVELPLFKAEKYVARARYHLASNEMGKADSFLKMAEDQARAIYAMIESPLSQARKRIWQANQAYSDGRLVEAKGDLEAARAYLEKGAKQGSAGQQEAVGILMAEVADLEKKIAVSSGLVATELRTLWERSRALTERMADYLSAGLTEEETTLKGESNLIEAKLHVAYAETFQVTAGEPGKAVEELGKADVYLRKALQGKLVDKATAARITAVDEDLLKLKSLPPLTGSEVRDLYESAKERLDALIREI